MAKRCKAKTQSGDPCKMPVIAGGDYCFTHNPGTRAAQAKARKAGGDNRHTPHFAAPGTLPPEVTTITDARQILAYTLREVEGMDNSIARARVLLALFDSYIKAFEITEIEARLTALEQRAK